MSFNEKFSVLMSVYAKDSPDLFKNALRSVISNSILPTEFIVVADGELTVELSKILYHFSDHYPVKVVQLPRNLGLAKALNVGLSYISAEYTIRADADDFNYPNRFKLLLSRLDEGFDLVGSAIREVGKDGAEVAFRRCPLTEVEIRHFAKKRNPFNHMTVGYRTAAVVDVGGYPEIYLKEDYALWATLLSKGARVCNLDSVLVDATAGRDMYRRRGGLRYAFAELELQQHLVECGLKSIFCALIDGVMRSVLFLSPSFVREFVYLRFLRIKKKKVQ
jgi:glycosyltransferase involved in cell wall biosynthesis